MVNKILLPLPNRAAG